MRLILLFFIGLIVLGCAPLRDGEAQEYAKATRAATLDAAYFLDPAAQLITVAQPPRVSSPQYTNADLVNHFMALSFSLENGRELKSFSRFEGPISIRMTGRIPKGAREDLDHLRARLLSEAGIALEMTSASDDKAQITLNFVSRAALRDAVPNAACFIVPNVTNLDQYRALRGHALTNWAVVAQRRAVGVFLPANSSRQEVRDCLHEEVAQAIGPLNDIYQLPNSVFNDDNFHAVLTDFDMLMLRAYYAPELETGMSKAQVAQKISHVFAKINKSSGGARGVELSTTPKQWRDLIVRASHPQVAPRDRLHASAQALALANRQGWQDLRLGFSQFLLASNYLSSDTKLAHQYYEAARKTYQALPHTALHLAHVDMQLANLALRANQPQRAIALADRAAPMMRQGQNLRNISILEAIRSKSSAMLGV